jgi:hypothetical protein
MAITNQANPQSRVPMQPLLNHHFSQKLKPIEIDEFNHLIYILTLPITCELKFSHDR